MIKQLLNSVIAKYRDLSVSRRSVICLRLQQIMNLLSTDTSQHFAQPHPIAGFQCHAIENKNQNHSIDEVKILRKERR